MSNQTNRSITVDEIRKDVLSNEHAHIKLLEEGLMSSFTNLNDFQAWISARLQSIGLEVEKFLVDQDELKNQPANQKTLRENPESLQQAVNIVGKLKGEGPRHGVLLFAHADKQPETFEWAKEHPQMIERDGRLYGPGIADDVCGLTAMVSAVETYKRLGMNPQGDVLVASILGKQNGVFGTYGLMQRYGPLDAAIYIHPAESGDGLGELKMSSNGCLEFIIQVEGKEPDSTDPLQAIFSTTAVSAVQKTIFLYQGLLNWADDMRRKYRHTRLEELCNQSFSLAESRFTGIAPVTYKMPTHCELCGTIVFPPNARYETVKNDFENIFIHLVQADAWLSQGHASLEWGDLMGESGQSDENSDFMQMATRAIQEVTGITPKYYYGHTTSDIRYPILYWNAQAFGVGPLAGDIAKKTEWVDRNDYLQSIIVVTEMLKHAA